MSDREIIENLLRAWESLPDGMYRHGEIQTWLKEYMSPAINEARKHLDWKPYEWRRFPDRVIAP